MFHCVKFVSSIDILCNETLNFTKEFLVLAVAKPLVHTILSIKKHIKAHLNSTLVHVQVKKKGLDKCVWKALHSKSNRIPFYV